MHIYTNMTSSGWNLKYWNHICKYKDKVKITNLKNVYDQRSISLSISPTDKCVRGNILQDNNLCGSTLASHNLIVPVKTPRIVVQVIWKMYIYDRI